MYDLGKFIAQYLGVGEVGDTAINKGQCVGLVEAWLTANGKAHVWGDAKDLPVNAVSLGMQVVHNTALNFPLPGAIVCWGASWGDGHGHTAVVVAANAMHLAVFEQNNPAGGPCVVATHGYGGVVGWFVV